jgi:superfamily II DNA or RNA helicase
MFSVLRRIVYSDPSRLEAVRGLMDKHPKMIIFYNFNYELEILRTINDTWSDLVTVAEWNGHKKQPIPDTDNWVYLVQYMAGAEGWNCTETDAMVFYSLTYSYKQFEQAQGRIDRLNTYFSQLFYYSLLSNSLVDRAVKNSLKKKETFNEYKWVHENLPNLDPLYGVF